MAKYVSLLNWTDLGIRSAKESVNRAAAARQAFQAGGGKITDVYWTLGQHDVVLIFDAPDDETAFRLAVGLGMKGNVRTSTTRAFGEEEMARILQRLS